jgi:DNA polymerase-4
LKARVNDATGLVVSVGIASNKLVAKIACRLGKPDGLRVVAPGDEAKALDPLPIRYLWGIGPVLGDKLIAVGIRSVGDLARAPAELVARAAGDRAAYFVELARGVDDRPVVADRAPKSIGEESTFGQDVSEREKVVNAIVAHAEEVARRLRRSGYRASCVTLKIKLAKARSVRHGSGRVSASREPDYPLLTRQRRLHQPSNDGQHLAHVATELWDEAGVVEAVRLIGVSVSALSSKAEEQLELFAPRRPQVGPTLDAIRERFGATLISRAVEAPAKVTPGMRRKTGD